MKQATPASPSKLHIPLKPWQRPPMSWTMIFALFMLGLNLLGVAVVLNALGY